MKLLESILQAASLIPSLPQSLTNGGSVLGTLDAPYLPHFLRHNPLPQGVPWGTTCINETDSCFTIPNTGVVRQYHFTISREVLAPDGVKKLGLFIDGQFPGPLIEANWGDTIQVTVVNNITGPAEGTSMHWHGIQQRDTPWMDGVPSVSQCPIAPNSTFTYTFRAVSYGTSWYHSHYSAQYADGLLGPLIVYGPKHADEDIDIGPVLLSDHFHTPYYKVVQAITGKSDIPNSDNNLINGKMNYDCSLVNGTACTSNSGISKFRFQSAKKHRLRLINSGAEGIQKFTIDNHTMTVIANDLVPVKPYQVDVVTLGVGQRADIIVEGTGAPTGAFWMRSNISTLCSHTNQSLALAAIYYEDADTNSVPRSLPTSWNDDNCSNDDLEMTEPLYKLTPPEEPAITQLIDINFGANATGAQVWKMNNESFRANFDHPILLLAKLGNTSYPYGPQWNVYNFHNKTSIRLIVRSMVPLAHPMHIHGHNFWVVAEGQGEWKGTATRPQNPQRRDTQILAGGYPTPNGASYIVLDFLADNPGIWPFHCHVAWHVSDGLYLNIMERPDLIKNERQIPCIMAQTCRDWADYSGHNVVDQIDSGL